MKRNANQLQADLFCDLPTIPGPTAISATVYTDGSCHGNPGPGGWAAILNVNGTVVEISGGDESTTNNRMEITSALRALERLAELGRFSVTIYTDSQYVQKAMSAWIFKWKRTGWKKGTVKNRDLWERLDAAAAKHSVSWQWVRGHNGDHLNERCDQLATAQTKRFLRQGRS